MQEDIENGLTIPEWMPEPLVEVWEVIDSFPFVGFLLLVILAYVAARVIELIVCRGLRRVAEKTRTDLDDRAIDLIHQNKSEEVVSILDRLDADAYL